MKLNTAPERTAAGLLVIVFAICVYRAVTQSIVHDEALTYEIYLSGPLSQVFHYFDANHHFLNTILMRITTFVFGFSALTMRLPALAGTALLLTALSRFCRWMLGSVWALPVAVAPVALNPFLMDFMVAARGYGLALGLWMWALTLIAPELQKQQHDRRNVAMAGAAAALSVTANLIFAMPVAVLSAIVVWFAVANRKKPASVPAKKREAPKQQPKLWLDFFAPAAAIAVVFLMSSPLENAHGEHFYTGAPTIAESLRSLAESSIDHSGPAAYHAIASQWIDGIAFGFGPFILLAGAIAGFRTRNLGLILISTSALGSAILLVGLHWVRDMPYPADRTGIYFIAAVILTVAGFGSIPVPSIRIAALAITGLMAVSFAIQFEPRLFSVWRYDAESREISERLADIAKTKKALNVSNSWALEPALNFYRETRPFPQLPEFSRRAIGPGADVYVITEQDSHFIHDLGLTIVYTGPLSQTVIAVPPH